MLCMSMKRLLLTSLLMLFICGSAQAYTLAGCVAWYTFNEGVGSNVVDSSGFGNHAFFTNQVAWTNGEVGRAVTFLATGRTNYVATPITNLASNALTISWWQNCTQTANNGAQKLIWSMSTAIFTREFSAQVFSDNNWYIGWNTSADQRIVVAATAANWPTNTWTHYALTTTTTNEIIYMNGVPFATNTVAVLAATNSGANLLIGTQKNAGSLSFPGSIDDYRIYNRTLTQSEIKSIYGGGYGKSTP